MTAGRLIERVAFVALVAVPDGSGGSTKDWVEQISTRASFRYLRGGETIVAARLSGTQPVVVTIRSHSAARQIDPDWRMRDVRRGTIYNVRTVVPTDDRKYLELTCESGVAV